MKLCTQCWRRHVKAGPNDKSPNFTRTMRTRIYAAWWCPVCGEPADGFVEMDTPEDVVYVLWERSL